jgi:hypothetical protein
MAAMSDMKPTEQLVAPQGEADKPSENIMTQAEYLAISTALQVVKTSANGWGKVVLHLKAGKVDQVEWSSSAKVKEDKDFKNQT